MKNSTHAVSENEFSNHKWLKNFVFLLTLVFYASFLIVPIGLPAADNDAGLYISDGKVIWETKHVFRSNIYSFTVPDQPVYDHHWLSSITFYFTNKAFGFGGLTILKTIVLLSAFAILFRAAIKKADFWLVAVFSFPTILILAARNRIRPEMFSYLFLALFLYLLFDLEKNPERNKVFWLIPLQLLWVNFHLFFFLGIVLVGGFLFEKIVPYISKLWLTNWKMAAQVLWGNIVIKKLLLILLMLFVAVFINPNGMEGVLAPFKTHTYASFMVGENQPLFNLNASFFSWSVLDSLLMIMVLIFIISSIFGFWKKTSGGWPVFFLLAGLGSASAGLLQARLITLFACMFLPAVSSNFNGTFIVLKDWLKRKLPKLALIFGYGIVAIIIIIYPYKIYNMKTASASQGYTNKWGIGLDEYSNDAGEFFKKNNLKGPIFNDYDIGGYIIYHLFPEEKVFVDNNGADSYPVSFFDDIFMPALSEDSKWIEVKEKYNLNAIFISVRSGSPSVGGFLWKRLHDPEWSLVYADTYALILLKNTPENVEIIKKFKITPENVRNKMSPMLNSLDVMNRVVAGRIFYLMGLNDLAVSSLKKVVAEFPKNSWAWLYMGAIKTDSNNPADLTSAIIFIQNAIDMGEKTSEGYTWLGLAYFKFGQFEKAENAFQKALQLDPGRLDTTNYLRQLQIYLIR